ncbi:MAG: leucine--tRNA ligase [Tenuifilaceae bacterium]|jgi:leucyl-tRNA synthetase|nr:leucine--tRNA ligase [Bacteroidales bacterium]MDI9515838.1 leucine--tRNA ligase [Bacteroidota bacterium]OQC62103.1 MAG: Leucine--tRNA ligase [Bacteroidetes bacterium ADurb.Bin008]HNV81533.1 leucine--tRNA ligase [Tenuifilaceae bacterium]MZP82116.1 leucine--tRNA ligase [Bacteroidales bacterium]
MDYNFAEIEKKWQQYWKEHETYRVEINRAKPKYYVLDMFPYPSGAGLHVGHPLGYIASDIYSRYKRLKGFNVLHPMGYDAFGLPAEQYAIQTGQHPAITTDNNIKRYREQLDKIGFNYDWNREVRTCDPKYYHWTQWAFLKMFNHWYNNKSQKAEPIEGLIAEFEKNGNMAVDAACSEIDHFTAQQWKAMSEKQQQEVLLAYRIAYLADTMVNWCPALGTVLANDEVKEGLSVRGGHPVEQRKMRQWCLRISAYAERLLNDLETIDWSDSLKEIQRNWIGRSEGAEVTFAVEGSDEEILVFTTRPDTIYGATFMVLAPESELVDKLTTAGHKAEVEKYVTATKRKTERERQAETKKVTGVFTGSYAINPFTKKRIPIWVGEYILAGYGTGAIMAVPAHDSRDFAFAKTFGLPIVQTVIRPGETTSDPSTWDESYDAREGIVINSGIINGLEVEQAIKTINGNIEQQGLGRFKVNYRLRDAIFSRQRYWGEPFPIYYKDGMPYPIDESKLPLELPEVDAFLPTEKGEPPLGRAKGWHTPDGYPYEMSTMPGFAGSSAYYLRYMDPHNNEGVVSKEANEYWENVDLYIGGTEHATGHLVYSRFWNKFLYDLGIVCKKEPFKKLINQGMIQGRSNFVYRVKGTNKFVSHGLKDQYDVTEIHVDVNIVSNDILDIEQFRAWRPEFANAEFILENGKYLCGWAVEKMSKSMYNVVNPDQVIEQYGADTFRIYEMFLGPLELSKPWDTHGIDGAHKFLRRVWRLYHDANNNMNVSNEPASRDELKVIHKTIKKVGDDIEKFNFNTGVSAYMICLNELSDLKCNKREVLEPLAIILAPYAPHFAEELWHLLGNNTSVCDARWPEYKEEYLVESTFTCPVSFNGKTRFTIELPLNLTKEEVEQIVMQNEQTNRYLNGEQPKKIVVVPNKIVNIVV